MSDHPLDLRDRVYKQEHMRTVLGTLLCEEAFPFLSHYLQKGTMAAETPPQALLRHRYGTIKSKTDAQQHKCSTNDIGLCSMFWFCLSVPKTSSHFRICWQVENSHPSDMHVSGMYAFTGKNTVHVFYI